MANITKIRVSGTTYNIVDESAIHSLEGYATSAETESAITAATAALAESIAEQHYQTSGDVQNAISGKADTTAVTESINAAVSGKSDTSALTVYADAVAYDSNAKEMKFYHGGTGGTEVFSFDASPFLIDGMVDNVEIKDVTISGESVTCLVISFNTDAGKQEIDIPLTEIFDASNYWTTAQTENAIASAISGKADTTAVTQEISAAVSGKQDTLISGTNIKTINNESLLGSGNIDIQAGGTVDQTIISGSTNAVAGGAVYTALQGKNGTITLDSETLVIS